jgi:hypothetical protein
MDHEKADTTGSRDRFVTASVITSKAAINDHFKTGQRNRGQDMKLFYRASGSLGKLFLILPFTFAPDQREGVGCFCFCLSS